MKRKTLLVLLVAATVLVAIAATTIDNFFMPGSQPGMSGNIETPDRCDNCHGGYDQTVEPAFNWRGSMMAQAARDPLFFACLDIAEQDAPGSGDLCIRCHAPDGWLNGRSTPTDGSALNNNDLQGVQCDFCHKLVKPTPLGTNPFPNDIPYTTGTYPQDQSYLALLDTLIPGSSSNGMYVADANNAKRGPFTDAVGRHQMFYSPFHSTSDICGTCHDVSNPAFTRANTSTTTYTFNGTGNTSNTFDLRLMLPVERTYSEWSVSDYNPTGPTPTTCQDCHMKDVTGKGAKMKNAPVRSNLPLHDMTGGNTFIPDLVKFLYPNDVDTAALNAGKLRAKAMLESAATLEVELDGTECSVKVTNETAHKLPSGYPEGRRIWVNLKAFDVSNNLVYESGAYDYATAELTTTGTKIYQIKPGLSPTMASALNAAYNTTKYVAGPSFHFAVNDMIYFDNRIPPAGCTNSELETIQSPVIGYTYADGQNYDETEYTVPTSTVRVEARLFYQTLSKDYVTFLDTANHTTSRGQLLYTLWSSFGKSAPELMEYAQAGASPPPPPLTDFTVTSFSVTRNQKPGAKFVGAATITVKDASNNLVPGAQVSVSYTGPTSGTESGTTDASGVVTLETNPKKNPSGIWCFTLTSVTKTGYNYITPQVTTVCEGPRMGNLTFENKLEIFPNPAREKVFINYSVATASVVNLEVFDNSGKRISFISKQFLEAGDYSFIWNTEALPKGVYHIRLIAGTSILTSKLLLIE